ncbi:MAG TPA: site-2 protease family protein [Phycisphaerae bacterium]|nr:site-2 protease family protein [Phycisphaerae bacterium]
MQSLAKRVERKHGRSRVVLWAVGLPVLGLTLAGMTDSVLRVVWVVLGFSLIIFLHELGHFLVARACSVKCLAFSLGIGPRILGWRKGVGVTFGPDPYDPDKLKDAKGEPAPTAEKRLEHVEAATTHSDLLQSSHEAVHPSTVGDCDYRISWLPLGGYVRMLGQDDMDPTKISDDPRAFNRRPIWQRMCIVSAGVIMNVIFAAVAFSIIFSPGIGIDFPPAQLGQVVYDSPAWNAGLKMGDTIVAVRGNKPPGKFLEFTDVMIASALSDGKEKIGFDYIPYGETAKKHVDILPVVNPASGFLAIGAESLPGMKVNGSGEEYAKMTPATRNTAELSKVRAGDQIVAADGVDVRDDYIKLYNQVQEKNGEPVKLTLENVKNKSLPPLEITLMPRLEERLGVKGVPSAMGLAPRLTLGEPSSRWNAASAAGIKDGDVVLQVGDRTNPTEAQFIEVVSSNPGKALEIVVRRDGQRLTLHATPKSVNGKGMLGIPVMQDTDKLSFMPVGKNPDVEDLQLSDDATIVAVDGQKVENWSEIYTVVRQRGEAGKTLPVTFHSGKGDVTKALAVSADELDAIRNQMQFMLGIQLENRTQTQVANNAWGAVEMGMDHTKKFILQVYMTLAGLFRQTVSPSNLHGIVGITKVGYDMQQRGIVWLWYVLALVSVNLAVANFLPLPIVDGGLFLLLILEKIRGKPLSLKVQSAIQVVGIVLLAGLFLYVTVNDISLFH